MYVYMYTCIYVCMYVCMYIHCLYVCIYLSTGCHYYILFIAFPEGVLAVNYLDAAQEDFGISYQFVNTTGGMIDNTIQYRSIQGSDNWLRSKDCVDIINNYCL